MIYLSQPQPVTNPGVVIKTPLHCTWSLSNIHHMLPDEYIRLSNELITDIPIKLTHIDVIQLQHSEVFFGKVMIVQGGKVVNPEAFRNMLKLHLPGVGEMYGMSETRWFLKKALEMEGFNPTKFDQTKRFPGELDVSNAVLTRMVPNGNLIIFGAKVVIPEKRKDS